MDYKVGKYFWDNDQKRIIFNNTNYLLVVAGAGSGKTLTIVGKIKYLITIEGLSPNQILCLSFTKEASNSLKNKIKNLINYDIPVYTFHKLSLEILKENNYSYEISDENLLDFIVHEFLEITVLKEPKFMKYLLKYFKIRPIYSIEKQYMKFYNSNYEKIKALEKNIITFIHLFKCHNYTVKDFNSFLKKIKKIYNFNYPKEKIFLIIVLNIYLIYSNYLSNNKEIDFDDMITLATECVKNKGIKKDIKYIIIDEYQDTSFIRFNLIKEIINCCNSRFMVVGDDYQAIYRFTGCDISLFWNFQQYFKGSQIMKIENNYRNCSELIKIMTNFITKNKYQIEKELKSNKSIKYPIKIVFYKDIKKTFLNLITKIYNDFKTPILILGRNNNDVKMLLNEDLKLNGNKLIYKNNKDIDMYYLTVHKAKGLEEENVIIINLINGLNGFPCQIIDNKILRLVSNNKEYYPFSEERRLFYVALTRTKNYVYLLTPYINSSIFVKELLKDKSKAVKVLKM